MQSVLILIACFLIASLPVNFIFNWFLMPQAYNLNSSKNAIHFPTNIFHYLIKQGIFFSIGFGLFFIAENRLFFQPDSFILLGFILITCGFFWSFFNGFKTPKYFFFFILGIYSFFSINFLIFIPVFYLVFSLLSNSIYMGLLITIIASFSAPLFFEPHYLFTIFNSILLVLSILRYYSFLNQKHSLTELFQLRN